MREIKKNLRFSGRSSVGGDRGGLLPWPPSPLNADPAAERSRSKSQVSGAGGRLSGNGAVSGKFCRSALLTGSAADRCIATPGE